MPIRDHNLNELDNTATTIKLLCAIFGIEDSATDINLQSAWDSGYDVLLIQKPWNQLKVDIWLTNSHPRYEQYMPLRAARSFARPRSIIYSRKRNKCY